MTDWPKAVTTSSIWISIGFALGFGLFRMSFSGSQAASLVVLLTGILVGGGVLATYLVWRSKAPQTTPQADT